MPRVTLTDGSPVTPEHREIDPETGQQRGYVVLSKDERALGFVRPVRRSYKHVGRPEKLGCQQVTRMIGPLAETYARQPDFYTHTFCCTCKTHLPVGANGEFVWEGTNEYVGT